MKQPIRRHWRHSMHLDVIELRDFYATPVGRMVARHLAPAVSALSRVDGSTRVLGFGFATPYLGAFQQAERVLAFMPAAQGVMDWPGEGGSATALVDEAFLPLPDASIDLVVLVHALEAASDPQALMSELRRVLTRDGRLVAVAPNRKGPWARSDLSPFGFGQPYSRGQLRHLFIESGFEAVAWTSALHMPPARWNTAQAAAAAIDKVGRFVWPAFAGVTVVCAVKRNVQGVAARARVRLSPALRPALYPAGLVRRRGLRLSGATAGRSPGRP